MLEQLRHAEEQGRCLLRGERLSSVQEVDDTRQEGSAFPRRDGRLVEHAGLLNDRRLVIVERYVSVWTRLGSGRDNAQIPPDSSSFLNDMAGEMGLCV